MVPWVYGVLLTSLYYAPCCVEMTVVVNGTQLYLNSKYTWLLNDIYLWSCLGLSGLAFVICVATAILLKKRLMLPG